MSKTILLYNDQIKENKALRLSLAKFCYENDVAYREVTGNEVLSGVLDGFSDDLFVMPGGESKHYSRQLGILGEKRIKEFVENGGGYFGICAGAYFACQTIDWHDKLSGEKIDTDNTHKAQKPLGFLPITASGPVYQFPRNAVQKPKSYFTLVKARMIIPGQKPHDSVAVYNGGPGFDDVVSLAEKDKTVTVLGGMADGKHNVMPAIIEKHYGAGRVIVSSLHFEVAAHHISGDNPVYTPIQSSTKKHLNSFGKILQEYDKQRENAWDILLKYALSDVMDIKHQKEYAFSP